MSNAQAEKMKLSSMDIAEEKRAQLKQLLHKLLPEAVSGDDIDIEQLKRALGDWVEPGKERFGLQWPGKAECIKSIQQPSVATLKPVRAESINFDKTENLFIEGDNLEVLKLMQKPYFGKVKMIYIDPPYNTGNDFIYPDKYSETLDTYLAYTGQIDADGRKFSTNADTDGRYHSRWLNMMYPRLYLARNLLRDDGVILISIDDKELCNLKELCNQIFGEENFIESIIWRKKSGGGQQDEYFVTEHDYIVCYSKNKDAFKLNNKTAAPKMNGYNYFDEAKGKKYKRVKLAKWGSASLREDRPTMYEYPELIGPDGKQALPKAPDGRPGRWRYGRQRVIELLKDNGIDWEKVDGEFMPYEKDYEPSEDDMAILKERSIIYDLVENGEGANELTGFFGVKDVFQNPKPSDLIAHLALLMTKPDESDIVLDFFAGSASTAHGVMRINQIDQGDRKFICVQLPEPIDPEKKEQRTAYEFCKSIKVPSTIAEISKERIRRASKQISEEISKSLDFKDSSSLDLGFKVFKLDRSNFKVWEGSTEQAGSLEKQLSLHVDHIAKASTPEDILYELLLKAGFSLTTKVEKVKMAGKEVFSIHEGALLICLEKELTQQLIDALAEANPVQVICLDEGFNGNDQLKANAVQTFKARAQAEESEIVFKTV